MVGMLGLGVAVRWADAGPADFTPLIAMVAALTIARFVLRIRLSVMTFMLTILAGALWAGAAAQWGFTVPTLAAILVIGSLSVLLPRAGTS